jgi:hypothetical protein
MSLAEGIRLSDSSERSRLVSEGRNSNAVGRSYPVQTGNVGSRRRGNGTPANVPCFYRKKVGHVRRDCRIIAKPTSKLPQVEVQLGPLHATGFLNSFSARSVVSYEQIKQKNSTLMMAPISFSVLTASRQSLLALGEMCLKIKIAGFSWSFLVLVMPDLVMPLFLAQISLLRLALFLILQGHVFIFVSALRPEYLFYQCYLLIFPCRLLLRKSIKGLLVPISLIFRASNAGVWKTWLLVF